MGVLLDDARDLLLESPAVAPANRIRRSTRDSMPIDNDPVITLLATGGTGPEFVQNKLDPEMRKPGLQVTITAGASSLAYATAQAAFARYVSVRNWFYNGTLYLRFMPLNEPFDNGLDDKERQRVTFNLLITRT
jgi:hypothetical protein